MLVFMLYEFSAPSRIWISWLCFHVCHALVVFYYFCRVVLGFNVEYLFLLPVITPDFYSFGWSSQIEVERKLLN